MKFREFLRKLSPNTTGSFYQVRTEIDPFEVRDQEFLVSNIELRLIDPPSEADQNITGDFVEPERIRDEVRVYNSPNEAISEIGEDFSRYSEENVESDHLRGLTEDTIAFHGDQNSLLFGEVYKTPTSRKFSRVALVLGILVLLGIFIIAIAAVILIRFENSSKSEPCANKSDISHSSLLLDRGQLDFLSLLNRQWPLPDIDSYIKSYDTTEEIPEDLKLKYYTTAVPGDIKRIKVDITSSTAKPTPIIVRLPLENIVQKYVDARIIQGGIFDAKIAVNTQTDIDNQTHQSGFFLDAKSPEAYYQYFNKINEDNRMLAESGFSMQETYRSVVKRMKLTKLEGNEGRILLNGTIPQDWCSNRRVSEIVCTANYSYRTLDGSCNNLMQKTWGSSKRPYRRILFPDYDDGISNPRVLSIDGYPLPSAREISKKVHVNEYREDYDASSMFPLWSQFVYHDLVFTAMSSGPNGTNLACCKNGIHELNPNCFPMDILDNDLLSKFQKHPCMSFVRSAPYQDCHLGPREQLNQATSYLDGSSIYGTTLNKTMSLRLGKFGKLKTFHGSHQNHGKRALMPIIEDINDPCNKRQQYSFQHRNYCFQAGDPRVNEMATLTSLHTLWVRQHNHISENLISQNPHWGDEKLFQEARRFLIAQIQHITYNEFLPDLLGPELLAKTGLKLLKKGYYESYDPTVNPSISNVFGTAFLFGDSMIQGLVKMIDVKKKNEGYIQLQKFIMNSSHLWTKDGMDSILKGATIQPASKVDIFVSDQLTQHYLQNQNSTFGLDLIAMNIQKSRDHGLRTYSEWRNICGLSPINGFHELQGVWHADAIQRIPNVYKSMKDIDVYTGMLAEKHVPGGKVGPTLACIVADQFLRLRKGDRFWYEGDILFKHFKSDQLKSIRSTTLAKIMCDNGDIHNIQLRSMKRPSSSNNPIQSCLDIPSTNYEPWKEKAVYEFPASESQNSLEESIENNSNTEVLSKNSKGQGSIILDLSSKKSLNDTKEINNTQVINKPLNSTGILFHFNIKGNDVN